MARDGYAINLATYLEFCEKSRAREVRQFLRVLDALGTKSRNSDKVLTSWKKLLVFSL